MKPPAHFSFQIAQFVLCAIFVGFSGESTRLMAQDPQVLVLQNGRVLRGHVTDLGDRVKIALNSRSQMFMPAEQVDFVCEKIEDAYDFKRSIMANTLEADMEIAHWCLQNDLRAEAGSHVLRALAIAPNDERVLRLERIWTSRRDLLSRESEDVVRTEALPVHQVGNIPQVDLEPQLLREFTTVVQPVLTNFCGTNNCHGRVTSSDLRLTGPTKQRGFGRNQTLRNLAQVLKFVEIEKPSRSPLLLLPVAPHGNAAEPIFDKSNQQQFQRLASWVEAYAVTRLRSEALESAKSQVEEQTRPAGLAKKRTQKITSSSSGEKTISRPPRAAVPPPSRDNSSQVDPFDPAIFNRRFFPKAG